MTERLRDAFMNIIQTVICGFAVIGIIDTIEEIRGEIMNLYEYFKYQNLERLKRIRTNYLIELKILNKVIKLKEDKKSKTKQIKFRGI